MANQIVHVHSKHFRLSSKRAVLPLAGLYDLAELSNANQIIAFPKYEINKIGKTERFYLTVLQFFFLFFLQRPSLVFFSYSILGLFEVSEIKQVPSPEEPIGQMQLQSSKALAFIL